MLSTCLELTREQAVPTIKRRRGIVHPGPPIILILYNQDLLRDKIVGLLYWAVWLLQNKGKSDVLIYQISGVI